MKVISCLLILIFCFMGIMTGRAQITQQGSVDTLTKRLVEKELKAAVPTISFVETMLPDGSWKEIDYADSTTFNVSWMKHLERLNDMAIAYNKKGSAYYHSVPLLKKITSGFDHIYQKPLRSWNWWHIDIGGPSAYMSALILMKGAFTKNELLTYATFIKDVTDNRSHRGQNRVSVSMEIIYKGCITDDFALVDKGFRSLASTMVVEQQEGGEGIKVDNSFHQHRPQLYPGGYGMAYVKQSAENLALARQTLFDADFTTAHRELLANLLLKGHQLFGYRNTLDFGGVGRGISRENNISNIDSNTLNTMMVVDLAHASDYKAWKAHLTGAPFPAAYRGNKYFFKSDIMTQHGANYYLSAKVPSTRSAGTEMLNGENQKGYNLPLGATNIYTTGNEYKNIFPVWDWTKIPGTTAVNNQSSVLLQWYLYGNNVFAGGVSNGQNGAIAYEHSYNGVQAKKAYFFMGDALLCLGAGISALGVQSVTTSVNQCLLNDEVIISAGGIDSVFPVGSKSYKDLNWVYHDGIGYLFPQGGNITVKTGSQTGTWKSLSVAGTDQLIKKDVFSVWFNHGTAPIDQQYCYIIKTAKSAADLKKAAAVVSFTIHQNTPDIQSVSYGNYEAVIFYEPGTATLSGGLSLTSDRKLLVLLQKIKDGYIVIASDPIHHNIKVTLAIMKGKRKLSGTTLQFPTGDMKGSAVTGLIKL